jgi:hypothetical protein
MNDICIKFIPHSQQRYPTVGDYFHLGGALQVRISVMKDWRHMVCVLIHELVELFIVQYQGVSFKTIDRFDMAFEKRRKLGNVDEPGDDQNAPYRIAHCISSGIERILAAALLVCWSDYAKEVESL